MVLSVSRCWKVLSGTAGVLLDSRLDDLAMLTAGIQGRRRGAAISPLAMQTLDPERDRLIDRLAAWGELPELETLHLMAHGAPGALYLGQDGLNLANVEAVAAVLRKIAPNLQTIALWGCHVAAGDAGAELLDRLHRLTGASVAASGDRLGAGVWVLESQRGSPDVTVPIDGATQRSYAGTLDWSLIGLSKFSSGHLSDIRLRVSGGTPYTAVLDDTSQLKVYQFTSGAWSAIGPAPSTTADQIALALAGTTPYVAFVDSGSKKAEVRSFSSGAWNPVGTGQGAGAVAPDAVDLEIDGTTPYLFYNDGSGTEQNFVAQWTGAAWTVLGGSGGGGGFGGGSPGEADLEVSGGIPYLAYRSSDTNNVILEQVNASVRTPIGGTIAPGSADFVNLEFSGGTPYVAYRDAGKVQVKKFEAGNWTQIGPDLPNISNALSLKVSGTTPYLLYDDSSIGSKPTVKYFDGTAWTALGSAGLLETFNINYAELAFDGGTAYAGYGLSPPPSYAATVKQIALPTIAPSVTPAATGGGSSPPPAGIYVNHPGVDDVGGSGDDRIIPDGTATEEPIARPFSDNQLFQTFEIVNNGGSALLTDRFNVSFSSRVRGGLQVGDLFEIIDPSTGQTPQMLEIPAGSRKAIQVRLKTKLPDGTPIKDGTYKANLVFHTNVPDISYYNFPIAGIVSPTAIADSVAKFAQSSGMRSSVAAAAQQDRDIGLGNLGLTSVNADKAQGTKVTLNPNQNALSGLSALTQSPAAKLTAADNIAFQTVSNSTEETAISNHTAGVTATLAAIPLTQAGANLPMDSETPGRSTDDFVILEPGLSDDTTAPGTATDKSIFTVDLTSAKPTDKPPIEPKKRYPIVTKNVTPTKNITPKPLPSPAPYDPYAPLMASVTTEPFVEDFTDPFEFSDSYNILFENGDYVPKATVDFLLNDGKFHWFNWSNDISLDSVPLPSAEPSAEPSTAQSQPASDPGVASSSSSEGQLNEPFIQVGKDSVLFPTKDITLTDTTQVSSTRTTRANSVPTYTTFTVGDLKLSQAPLKTQPSRSPDEPDSQFIVSLTPDQIHDWGKVSDPVLRLRVQSDGTITVGLDDGSGQPATPFILGVNADGTPVLLSPETTADRPNTQAVQVKYSGMLTLPGELITNVADANNNFLKGNDRGNPMLGLPGQDLMVGSTKDDILLGNEGDDLLRGSRGNDVLLGGQQNDLVWGEEGNDTLAGDNDLDTLYGGPGADAFVLGRDRGTDLIMDFEPEIDHFLLEDVRIDKATGKSYPILTLSELAIEQATGYVAIKLGDQVIAKVLGADLTEITAATFDPAPFNLALI